MPLRRLMVAVGALCFVAAAAATGARATYGARTTADEPQYLLTALSLAEDFDLDISDELADERFREFHEVDLNGQTIALNDSGQELSPHDPLLPLLLAGPMRVGGWVGAKLALTAMAGVLAAVTLWVAVRRFGIDRRVAVAVVGGFAMTAPLTSYGTQVYPEVPAALATMIAVAGLTGRLDRRDLALVAVGIAALPWLSVKYVPVAGALVIVAVSQLWCADRRESLARMAVGGLAAAAVYAGFHQVVYGGWTVYAAGDHFVNGELLVVGSDPDYWGRTRRLVGLLVDREFGLVAWNPAYLVLAPALGFFVRRRPEGWLAVTLPFAAGWATATWIALTMHGWWWPGRQVVIVAPLGVVMIALLVERWRPARVLTAIGLAAGVVTWGWIVFEATTDRRTLVVDMGETANPLFRQWIRTLPDHQHWLGGTAALTACWSVAIIAAIAFGFRLGRRNRGDQPVETRMRWAAKAPTPT